MKKLAIYLAATTTLLTSCDIDRYPYDKYSKENIMADKIAAVDIMLNGCYGELRGWSDHMHRVGEYTSDNLLIRGSTTDDFLPFITYKHKANNGRLNSFWVNSYRVISQTSDIMKMMSEGENEALDKKLGEAYFLRGTMYFYLSRVFGRPYYQSPETNMAVPIVNGMPDDINNLNLPDRSTVKEVYTQAIGDLRKGEALMDTKNTAAYASKGAAQAILARMYMYMSGTWDNTNIQYADSAIYFANQVINSGKYSLLNRENFMKFNTYAPDASGQTETIFAIKRVSSEFSGYDHYYGIGGMYATIQGMGWGEIFASATYLDLLNKNGKGKDARSAFIDPQYELDKAGNKTPVFRVVVSNYNSNNELSGYKYIQADLEKNGDNYIAVYKETINEKEVTFRAPLTLTNEEDQYYSFVYERDGKTYSGEKDYRMLQNRDFPMYYITKCSLQDGESHLHSPTITRLAEMYLILAECYAKKGDYANAITNLNIVRERSLPGMGYTSLNAENARLLIDEERHLELAFEADRGYDLYRNGQTLSRRYPGFQNAIEEIDATDTRVIHPIPQDQINAYNSIGCTLTQNP